jgi:hypothetical protein
MSVITNTSLSVKSYEVNFNFVESKIGSNDRISVITLYDAKVQRLAELHFFPGMTDFSVSEQGDHVQILMSSDHFNDVYQVLRGEKPLYILFFRDDKTKNIYNVWFGTSSHEPVGEEEGKGTWNRPRVTPSAKAKAFKHLARKLKTLGLRVTNRLAGMVRNRKAEDANASASAAYARFRAAGFNPFDAAYNQIKNLNSMHDLFLNEYPAACCGWDGQGTDLSKTAYHA